MGQKAKLAERIVYASKAAKIAKASRLGIVVSAILTFLVFGVAYYGEVVGNFTFRVEPRDFQAGISLFQDPENKRYTSRLVADKVENAYAMTAFCGTEFSSYEYGDEVCLPTDAEASSVSGSNNGESYLAYTFYLENAGIRIVDLQAKVELRSTSRGADESLRVRLLIGEEASTYALPQSSKGDNPGMPEMFTEPFLTRFQVMDKTFSAFKPNELVKITVILWFEGEDADHDLSIVGGGVKLDMVFDVTYIYQDDEIITTTTDLD